MSKPRREASVETKPEGGHTCPYLSLRLIVSITMSKIKNVAQVTQSVALHDSSSRN